MADDRRFLIRDERAAGELGFALAALEEVRGRTQKAIAGLDPAALSARPLGGGNSIGALARHVALVELVASVWKRLVSHRGAPGYRRWTVDAHPSSAVAMMVPAGHDAISSRSSATSSH